VSFRKIFENSNLPLSAGRHLYTLNWGDVGDIANGLYYMVLTEQSGGSAATQIMKIIVLR
jgi:hypothetical protein